MNFSYEELMDYFPVLPAILMENPQYFTTQTIYDIDIVLSIGTLSSTQNLFIDGVSPQLVCYKLVRNLAMLTCYQKSLQFENNIRNDELQLNSSKNYKIKFGVGTENVEIVNHKGFGLLGVSVIKMAGTLNETINAINKYIKKLSSTDENYAYLERVSDFSAYLDGTNIDSNLLMFIRDNKDFYEKYINMAEELANGYDE